jgi:bifunctional UDP-N-acetylglucosamine pyrophosphorylase/glucosamine-1-phosphate N-acetyltransferase
MKVKAMKALILAAGEGKRMRPLTLARPKAMLPVMGKPVLELILKSAIVAGVKDFIIVVGYKADLIKRYFESGERLGVKIEYVNQNKQLGTAHAIAAAESTLAGEKRFLILNSDGILSSSDIKKIMKSKKMALLACEVENPVGFGAIEASDGKVKRIVEKSNQPPSNLANAGVYIFTPEIFKAIDKTPISPRGEYEITDSIQYLIDSGREISLVKSNSWIDLTYPWDLLRANELLMPEVKTNIEGEIEPRATIKGNISLGKNSILRDGAYIIGPAIIGDNCEIGPNCYIRPSTVIGSKVKIGHAVEVKNSIIMNGTHIGHLSYVGDSIIGENSNLGAGTIIANLRFDEKNIKVSIEGKIIDSKRRKLGAIIADKVRTGINSMINAGTVIGEQAIIGPGVFVRGEISSYSVIK